MASSSPATYPPKQPRRKQQKQDQTEWIRSDGRSFHQCRPAYHEFIRKRCLEVIRRGLVFIRSGAGNAASGSAYAEFGSTKVIVSVFGPRESKKAMLYSDIGRLNCSVSFTTFATSVRGQGSEHKEFSSMLHKGLEGAIRLDTFPKTTVDVFALVLESGGSDLSVIMSCATIALADAGIMMYDLIASVSMVRMGNNLIIDPTTEEENNHDGGLMLTCMPSRNEVTQLALTGEWSTGKIHEAMELCLDACSKLGDIMRTCLKDSISEFDTES